MRRSRMTVRLTAVALLAMLLSGCASWQSPRIDPTGEHVFVQEPSATPPYYWDEPGAQLPSDVVAVRLAPKNVVAPIGAEVVLLAGVRGPDNYLRTNQRLEWSIAPGGVGQFVAVGQRGLMDLLVGDFNPHKKIDATSAVGSTSRHYLRLNRGTPTPTDDVFVLAGQGWITVTSPVEGTSHVTVFAPEVYPWDSRLDSATIHWIDAQWRFPPPAINPAGSRHTFTTVVMHQSDQCPCVGWHVRYEICGGPAAGFAPDGAQVVEVATNQAGQAPVEIFQKQAVPGTNKVNIQVIRPATPSSGDRPLVIANGSTLKTWTAAVIAVRKTGPAVGSVGATLTYRTEVSNPGDQPARDVLVTEDVPEGLALVGSNPAGQISGKKLQWRLGTLGPFERRAIDVTYRAEKQGSVTDCAEATAAGGLKAADCATTSITAVAAAAPGALQVKMTAPAQAAVGSQVSFEITVTNCSQVPATGLMIKDWYDAGLAHEAKTNPIERDLKEDGKDIVIAPGGSYRLHVTFRVAKAGRLSNRAEVTGPGGIRANAEAYVTAIEPGTAPGAVKPPTPSAPISVSVKKVGPAQQTVGEIVQFNIDVANLGEQTLRNVKVVETYDAALRPVEGTEGHKFQDGKLLYTIDVLPVGKEPAQLSVKVRCQAAAANACFTAVATAESGAQAKDEACVAIREAPGGGPPGGVPGGGLSMTITDLFDPITVNKSETYEIRVKNLGQTPDKLVSVVVTLPGSMTADPLGTTGPPLSNPDISEQTVRFEPVPQIKPGETLVYRVRARTIKPGQVKVSAELTSLNQPKPMIREEATDVIQ